MIIKSFKLNDLKKNESNFFLLYGENEGQKEEVIDNFFLSNFQGETVKYDENQILDFKLNIPGRHNALNAAAAVIVSLEENISSINIQSALSKFSGINRRMEFLGKMDSTLVVDDYGHHPNEIRNTIETLRESFRDKEINILIDQIKILKIADINTIIIIHRNKKSVDNIPKFLNVLDEKNYGLSKILFSKLI